MIISIFTPHGGCPERCSFCDQSVSGGTPVAAKAVVDTIEAHLHSRKGRVSREVTELAFYGGTFTAMARQRQLAYLDAAKPYLDDGRIQAVRVSTRPDALPDLHGDPWLQHLRDEYRLATVELGVQSFSPRVLLALGRSHSVQSVSDAVTLLRRLRLRSSLHLMIGCPGEADTADAETLEWLARLKPDFVRLHPLLVLAGTPLEASWREGSFRPLELEKAVERAAALAQGVERLGIKLIRLGLQPNELLGQSVVAGPYHPAFGDLVRGRRLRNGLEGEFRRLGGQVSGAGAEILVPEAEVGALKGKNRVNLEWLKTRFDLSDIGVRVVKGPPNGTLYSPDGPSVKIRLHHPDRTAQRGQVEPAQ